MKRFDVLNQLIDTQNLKSYLEIGTQQSLSGESVKAKTKTGVDPSPMNRSAGDYNHFHQMTSDDFFAKNKRKFDLIFIDGDHSYDQARKDFINSLKFIKPNGIIVLHDVLPHSKEYASPEWNGDVYKVMNEIIQSGFKYQIVDHDHGCGIVYPETYERALLRKDFTYEQFETEKEKWHITSTL